MLCVFSFMSFLTGFKRFAGSGVWAGLYSAVFKVVPAFFTVVYVSLLLCL